ncbi:hypothetical protein ELI13_30465 (plasmid) [Rhizobium ruizarguesonis]|uniref:hypothetical protein n=1 Tax=Rhizobium ruizarguesonis TaxID=2081791 RepID=UPI001031CBAF|nr:hypothetical protein [Rhizobium ruizarguesonis]TAU58408.1 hypothetical protein ELI46_39375 [Rhizobium ruizarguesonis]TAV18910.1 hypothetical protein ELI36_38175 [Rhizobium ruizarguesonis]TAV20056.1 hypothetical protein ELI33_38035 [Rhizobium ruizarguesonis]TAW49304.1 hypothetical protein ELI15_29390 [Rhizobium ruizarguesonis]TAW83980.1 hypothetical protein ELI13_30465 [Rhizobium ruizarguesonis]
MFYKKAVFVGNRSSRKLVGIAPLPRLKSILADTDDGELLQMFWAVHALQDGREHLARRLISFPSGAATTAITSRWKVHPWNLETLITLQLNTPNGLTSYRRVDTSKFDTIAGLTNLLGRVEDMENRDRINDRNILLEMHRIGHRTFQWQRGWRRQQDLYRYMYIYGQGKCAQFFQGRYGLTIVDFVSVCFALFGVLSQGCWTSKLHGLHIMGLDDKLVDIALPLVSAEIHEVRQASRDLLEKVETGLGTKLPVIYQPSYLRVKPIIRSFANRNCFIAPLPELILMRATVGLFYDLIPGGQDILNDANERFEAYARYSIKAHCPDFDPLPAIRYRHNKNDVDTPDIILKKNNKVVAVFECKATKLTFEAQYGEDPIANAEKGYTQIAKAIFQLWKFFSHVRRGLLELDVADDAVGIVLTMEAWTQMGGPLREKLINDAKALAAQKDTDIIVQDMRPPVFCPIQDLDDLLATSDEDQLLTAFRAATQERYHPWGIREVRQREALQLSASKPYPFDIGEFLPWWRELPSQKTGRLRNVR